jgi:hypothetical protein
MKPLQQQQRARRPFLRIFAGSVVAAALGAYGGFNWASSRHLPDNLLGMYTSAGAVIGVLALRFGSLIVSLAKEYLGSGRR